MTDWDQMFEEVAAETRKAFDRVDQEKVAARSREEFERGLRLGWWDTEGNPIEQDDEDDDDDQEEDIDQ